MSKKQMKEIIKNAKATKREKRGAPQNVGELRSSTLFYFRSYYAANGDEKPDNRPAVVVVNQDTSENKFA